MAVGANQSHLPICSEISDHGRPFAIIREMSVTFVACHMTPVEATWPLAPATVETTKDHLELVV